MLSDIILREAEYLQLQKPPRYELTTSKHEASAYYEVKNIKKLNGAMQFLFFDSSTNTYYSTAR